MLPHYLAISHTKTLMSSGEKQEANVIETQQKILPFLITLN